MLYFLLHLQARKIAPVFPLNPETLYHINEFDNVAVFPSEASGRFNQSAMDTSAVYVHGETVNNDTTTVTPGPGIGSSSPFGTSYSPHFPAPRPMVLLRKKSPTFQKTIAVVSLSNSSKPSTSKASTQLLDYKVVT